MGRSQKKIKKNSKKKSLRVGVIFFQFLACFWLVMGEFSNKKKKPAAQEFDCAAGLGTNNLRECLWLGFFIATKNAHGSVGRDPSEWPHLGVSANRAIILCLFRRCV